MTPSSTTLPRPADRTLDRRRAERAVGPFRAAKEVAGPRQSPAGAPAREQAQPDASAHIVVISANALVRTCLIRCLASSETGLKVEGHASIEAWRTKGRRAAIVLLCVVAAEDHSATERGVRQALAAAPGTRVVVISDQRSAGAIHNAIEQGASGYIAMDSSLDVAIAAIRLVRSGGVFVPAHSMVRTHNDQAPVMADSSPLRARVTAKQWEVISLIRKGLPNKRIAAELEMSEFTVKVHVRNIMKRLKARNRTEVAALTNAFFVQDGDADDWS